MTGADPHDGMLPAHTRPWIRQGSVMMRPVLLPLAEQLGRLSLRQRGAHSRFLDTRHGRIHYYDLRGSGPLPTTVVLHGLGAAATAFGGLLSRLQPHVRRALAPDHLGHGFSEGEDSQVTPNNLLQSTFEALDQTLPEPALLVGNSMGGAIAVKYALSRPQRVRALVLVSPAGARWTDEEWEALQRAFRLESRAHATQLLRRLYHQPPWFLSLLAHEMPARLSCPTVRALLGAPQASATLTPEELGALQVPTLLLWGESERLLPFSHLDYFARYLPKHAVIERPRGFGHSPHVDAPQALAARITAFGFQCASAQRGSSQYASAQYKSALNLKPLAMPPRSLSPLRRWPLFRTLRAPASAPGDTRE